MGPKALIQPTLAATTRIVFASVSPLQEAVAHGLDHAAEHQYFETQRLQYNERRQILIDCFEELRLPFTIPEGSYFILLVCIPA